MIGGWGPEIDLSGPGPGKITLMNSGRRVTVYCASSEAIPRSYHDLARVLGDRLARGGWEIVFGGVATGLMGTLGRAALAAGGRVQSVILRQFVEMGIGLEGVTLLEVVEDLRPRKARMEELSHACIALPGGFGTMEELLEIIVRKQLGFYSKPIVILNHLGYYDPLLQLFERAYQESFVDPSGRDLYRVAETADEAMALIGSNGAEC